MVAMCLVKDQTKRPTAEKLLKHSFFKHAKPPELSLKKLFTDLPPLWSRVKALEVCCRSAMTLDCFFMFYLFNVLIIILQLKDAAQLALRKMPSAEQEAISQVNTTRN